MTEQNMDLWKKSNGKKHGGARERAGRKAKLGETKVKRIPVAFENEVNALIEFLSNDKHQFGGESTIKNTFNLYSGKRLELTFKTKEQK